MDENTPLGPYARDLYLTFISREAVPKGGGFNDAAKFLLHEDYRNEIMDRSFESMKRAIEAVRSAPDNPYGDDTEAICKMILERIDKDTPVSGRFP